MATITTRSGKGSPLTNNEVDANFTNLNTDKAELSGATFTGNLSLGDNVKLQLGNQTNGDLQIYHSGTNSFVSEIGSGDLKLNTNGASVILQKNTGEPMVKANTDSSVDLYYDNAKKLATTSTGTLTTGTSVVSTSMMIGSTDSPSRDLEIKTTNPHIRLTDTDASGSYTEIFGGSGITTINADKGQNVSGSVLKLSVDATDGITIDSNHNVSIPNGNLDVTGSVVADGLTANGASEGDTYFTGGTANARLLNVFTSTHDSAAHAGHNFKIASGAGAFIFGNNTTANLLTVKSGGIDVTGSVVADGLTVENTSTSTPAIKLSGNNAGQYLDNIVTSTLSRNNINFVNTDTTDSASNGGQLSGSITFETSDANNAGVNAFIASSAENSTGSGRLVFGTGTGGTVDKRMNIASNGDISFYNDSAAQGLFWDSSTSRLGLGVTNPLANLDISSATTSTLRLSNTDTILTENQVTGQLEFYQSDASNNGTGITGKIGMRSVPQKPAGGNYYGNVADMDFYVSGQLNGYANDNASLKAMTIQAGSGNATFSGSVTAGSNGLFKNTANANGTTLTVADNANRGITITSPIIASAAAGRIATSGTANSLEIGVRDYPTAMAISGSTGNINIGSSLMVGATTAPSSVLEVMTAFTTGTQDIARFSRPTYGATVTIAREAGDGVVYSPANLTLSADHDNNSVGTNSNIKFKTDATERMRIDSSGRVGIGTNSPRALSHVYLIGGGSDDFNTLVTAYRPNTVWEDLNAGTTDWQIFVDGGDMQFRYGDASTDTKLASEAMRIDSSGRVGIGTSSPSTLLHLQSTDPKITLTDTSLGGNCNHVIRGADQFLELSADSGNSQSGSVMKFKVDNAEAMRIDSSGRVGIGTSSPANTLTVGNTANSADDQNATVGIKCDANHQGIMLQENSGAEQWSLGVNADGDLNFYDSQVTTPTVTFKDNGGVGIGTSSPSQDLHIREDSGDCNLLIDSANGASQIFFGDDESVNIGNIRYDHSSNYMRFSVNGSERMRIDSAGRVGIGTSSPSAKLDVQGGLAISNSSASRWTLDRDNTNGSLTFTDSYINEAMRIDSSGRVLVGKSSPTISTTGVELRPNGQVFATQSGNYPLLLNRTTSDGDIIQLRKDNTNVGSIGTASGSMYIEGNPATGKSGLTFYGSYIEPRDNGSPADNAIDLGGSTNRFKDLYLSGGVYLGGTGSANKLDDYEEGTFTATLKGSSEPASLVTSTSYYTKVGNKVHFEIGFENADTTGYSGNFFVTGLPFASTGPRAVASVIHYKTTTWSDGHVPVAIVGSGQTQVDCLNQLSGSSWAVNQHSAGTGRYFWITGTYITTS